MSWRSKASLTEDIAVFSKIIGQMLEYYKSEIDDLKYKIKRIKAEKLAIARLQKLK